MEIQNSSSASNQSIQERIYILEIIAEIANKLFSTLDLNELLNIAADSIPDSFGYDTAHIYLLDDRRKYAVIHAGSNTSKILVERGYRVEINDSTLVGWCILNGKSRIVVSDATPLFPMPHSTVVLPLIIEDEVIGVVEVFATQNNIQDEYLPDLNMMVEFITAAIENARMFSKLQKVIKNLKDQLLR